MKTNMIAKIITIFMFFVIGVLIGFAIYMKTEHVFNDFIKMQVGNKPLILYLIEFFCLLIFYLVFISSLIVGIYNFFMKKNDQWIISSPQFLSLPFYNNIKTYFHSLWPILVIAIPFLLAMKHVFKFSLGGFFAALISLCLLAAIGVLLMSVFVVFIGEIMRFIKKILNVNISSRIVLFLIGGSFILFSIYVWSHIIPNDFIEYFGGSRIQKINNNIQPILQTFNVFPSHFTALTLYNQIFLSWKGTLYFLGYLFLESILLFFISSVLFWFSFLHFWQNMQEGSFEASTLAQKKHKSILSGIMYYFLPPLFYKEMLDFFRSGKNILWLGFIISLWLVQIIANIKVKDTLLKYQLDFSSILITEVSLQIVILVLFITAITLRFVFPAFSLEKKYAWITASYPIDLKRVFYSKLFFFLFFQTLIAFIATYLNIVIFQVPINYAITYIIFMFLSVLFITVFGLSLGVLFPNFTSDDPSELSTSLPGLGFVLISLSYGIVGYLIMKEMFISKIEYPMLIYVIIILIISFILFTLARKRLKDFSFEYIYS